MKKILSLLPPLLCSSLLYHQQINGMRLENPDENNIPAEKLVENSTKIATHILNNQSFQALFKLIHCDAKLTDAAYKNSILHKDTETIFEWALSECIKIKNYDIFAQILLLTSNLKQTGLDELTIEPKISKNIYNKLQKTRNEKAVIAGHNLQQKQQNTLAQLTTLLETTGHQIEQLLANDKEQRLDYYNALTDARQDYQDAFACTRSISEKHILPCVDQPFPENIKNTTSLEVLIPTLAAIKKASEAINNHLLLPENAHLAIENRK